jgi:hypothetical protein
MQQCINAQRMNEMKAVKRPMLTSTQPAVSDITSATSDSLALARTLQLYM